MLEKLLRSGAEVKTLGVVLFEDNLHLREIGRRAKISPYEAKRELDNLVLVGLLKSQRNGKQVFFSRNGACPFWQDLKNLYLKTEGIVPRLKTALAGVEGIRFSFIFGSMASGEDRPESDIDLMVIGEPDENMLAKKVFEAQRQTGREINFVSWTGKDLAKNAGRNGAFHGNLMKGKRIWLVGNEDEFVRIAQEGLGQKGRRGPGSGKRAADQSQP